MEEKHEGETEKQHSKNTNLALIKYGSHSTNKQLIPLEKPSVPVAVEAMYEYLLDLKQRIESADTLKVFQEEYDEGIYTAFQGNFKMGYDALLTIFYHMLHSKTPLQTPTVPKPVLKRGAKQTTSSTSSPSQWKSEYNLFQLACDLGFANYIHFSFPDELGVFTIFKSFWDMPKDFTNEEWNTLHKNARQNAECCLLWAAYGQTDQNQLDLKTRNMLNEFYLGHRLENYNNQLGEGEYFLYFVPKDVHKFSGIHDPSLSDEAERIVGAEEGRFDNFILTLLATKDYLTFISTQAQLTRTHPFIHFIEHEYLSLTGEKDTPATSSQPKTTTSSTDDREAVQQFIQYLNELIAAWKEDNYKKVRYDTGAYYPDFHPERFRNALYTLVLFFYDFMKARTVARMGRQAIDEIETRWIVDCLTSFFGVTFIRLKDELRYFDYENSVTEKEWQHARVKAVNLLSQVRFKSGYFWYGEDQSSNAYFISRVNTELAGKNPTREEVRKEAEWIIAQEEKRLRAFIAAFHGTLRFLDAQSRLPNWTPPYLERGSIDEIVFKISALAYLLHTLIGETSSPYSIMDP